MGDMLEAQCERLVARLRQDNPAQELDAFAAVRNDRDIEAVAKAVLDAIDRAELEGGLDRLPTFVIKYVR